jgi:RNA polymerase sigma factor (sigma-70 family)
VSEDEDDHAALLGRVANRDEAAFNVLYSTYLPLVLRWTSRETHERELATDLTAEVFAAAMLAAPRYRPQSGSVGACLVGIAANRLRESRRRKRVEDSARRRLKLEPVVLTDADLELVDELVGMDDRLQQLIQTLPAEQQRAVVARVVDERSYEEIASEMECSPSVVRQRVSRGLRALRSDLEGS